MFDIIVFAIIAAFVVSRLFKVLGDTKYDRDQSEETKKFYEEYRNEMASDISAKKEIMQQINIASAYEASLDQNDRNLFEAIRKYRPTFTADEFIDGAKEAFEMILKAFSEHNREQLSYLLSMDVYSDFLTEIERREAAGQVHQVTLVALDSAEIQSTELEKGVASIVVKFVSEQIHLIKDAKTKELLSGNPSKVTKVEDVWTFSKSIKSKDNVWKLVGTGGNE